VGYLRSLDGRSADGGFGRRRSYSFNQRSSNSTAVYERLEQDRTLSIVELRVHAQPFANCPLAELEEISRCLGYTPMGTKAQISQRLIANLESINAARSRQEPLRHFA